MAKKDKNEIDKPEENAGNDAHTFNLAIVKLYAFLGIVGMISGILKFPDIYKAFILILIVLFWIFFEFNKSLRTTILDLVWKRIQKRQGMPTDKEQKAQIPVVRWGLGWLLLLFLLGWGCSMCNEPPPPAMVYYMVVLDVSDSMKEPFDVYPNKWVAVREAFQEFYDRSHPDSNYGLVIIDGQNPHERSMNPCSQPTIPLIPLVSESGKTLPHRNLTLTKLQEQVEGQQPQGGGSLSRAFFLAKNQLESLPAEATKVIVLIANTNDTCEGEIDWDTLATEIELVSNFAIRKELILLDVDATQQTTAFADNLNAMNDPNLVVQVVQNYYQLELSISYILERNEEMTIELVRAATATAQSGEHPMLPPISGQGTATILTATPQPTKLRKVMVAASATSTPTLKPTFTPTLTFTPTAAFNDTPTLTGTSTISLIYLTQSPPPHSFPTQPSPPPPPTADTCCKHCGPNSQPCGDSCIALGLTCHQPPGCACNGSPSIPTFPSPKPSEFPPFPWPVPKPSAFKVLTLGSLGRLAGTGITLHDVDERISSALDSAGYDDKSYFGVPGGFAIVTRLEKMDEDGFPDYSNRWASSLSPISVTEFSLTKYLEALFGIPKGHYRVFVFVVSSEPVVQSGAPAEQEEAQTWVVEGANQPPSQMEDLPYTREHTTTVYIYEFIQSGIGATATYNIPSDFTGRQHLERAGLWNKLEYGLTD